MTATLAFYAEEARRAFERLDESTKTKVRHAVRRLVRNPDAGSWIRESGGLVLRMRPVDGWRIFYVVWESEIIVTAVLRGVDAPGFPV